MHKHWILLMISLMSFCLPVNANKRGSAKAASEVINRVIGESDIPVKYCLEDKGELPFFEYSVENGVLNLKGNTCVALCSGFYDYVKKNNLGMHTWSGTNIKLPKSLPAVEKVHVESGFKNNYYFNVVTFGYSTPYWDWARWEKEIDWMAFHGIDMPLALIANEAIMARVYKKFGFTDKEIDNYFVGPAHLPFLRMGLMEKLDGPLGADWYKRTIDLQHKVLKRMKELGMDPICPAFAGFVPEEIKKYYPNVEVVQTHWGGAFSNWMISPEDPLFSKISTEYIKEWEKEFGKCEYYISDSFNEMEIPFPPKENPERYELLSKYGDVVYQSIKNANPDAVWVMQGWMFGYQRYIWDYKTLEALVSKVPKGKILLLDLAVDYNKTVWNCEVNWDYYKGFFGQPWVYSTIPNMGGKIGWTGVLEFYANGHLESLHSVNRGNLVAYGVAPEGIENNEVIYELLSDARWSREKIDLKDWLKSFSTNRYGTYSSNMEEFWTRSTSSVYSTLEPHPRFNWQSRPRVAKWGTIMTNDNFYLAIEAFLADSENHSDSKFYRDDLAEATAMYVGGKLEVLSNMIETYYLDGDIDNGQKLEKQFDYLMLGIDKILSVHPTLKLENWLNFAEKAGANEAQKKQYVSNAKRIVTIWGPPIDDYSARLWSGLIRDYYLPRWKKYFEACRNGVPFEIAEWEKNWVENELLSESPVCDDVISLCKELIDSCRSINKKDFSSISGISIGKWGKADVSKNGKDIVFSISTSDLKKIKGIRFIQTKRKAVVYISNLSIVADGIPVYKANDEITLDQSNLNHLQKISIPKGAQANNGCEVRMTLKGAPEIDNSGEIYIVL